MPQLTELAVCRLPILLVRSRTRIDFSPASSLRNKAVDRPTILDILSLDADDESVILVTQSCSSSSGVWILMSYLWQLLLLLVATILVFQSSDTSEEMNEKQLGYLVYSQFVSVCAACVVCAFTQPISWV